MMIPNPQLVKDAASRAAKQAVLGTAGALLAAIGVGFLTSALWIFLARWQDSLFASLAVGVLFLLLAGVALAMGKRAGRSRRVPDARFHSRRADPLYDARAQEAGPFAPPRGDYPPLMEAFLFGLNTAAKVRRRKTR